MGKTVKRKFGDRKDGRRLRTLDPYYALTPYIMKTKSDASNFFSDTVEITEVERFLRQKRTNGYPGMGLLHLFLAAYIRVVAQYPAVNRFVAGQRIYARNNIEFVMTIKKGMSIESGETSVKAIFDPRDTIEDVYTKLNAEIDKVKNGGDTSTDGAAAAFMKMPRLFLKFAIWMLGVLDYFGKLPKSLVDASPFHGSIIITDLGSIGLPTIYHHLYNFGNMPLFVAFGAKKRTVEIKPDGTPIERKYVDYSLVLDERICDGFYFSQVHKLYKSLLRNPRFLEVPPDVVVEDVK